MLNRADQTLYEKKNKQTNKPISTTTPHNVVHIVLELVNWRF